MKKQSRSGSRRTFIKNMTLMGGAGILLTSVAKIAGPGLREDPIETPDACRSQGYRLTPHIRTYYKKAAS